MGDITFNSANNLFSEKKYGKAFDQFCALTDNVIHPAFCSFMAGKCLTMSKKIDDAYTFFQKALDFDDSNAFINREIERYIVDNNLIDYNNKQVVYHYFPNTTNIGDSGSAAGIRSLFHSLSDTLFFYTLSCRKDTIDALKSNTLNPSGTVIGGGGLFFRQPLPSGWYFPLSQSQLADLNIPAITYAIGLNKEYSDEGIWNLDNDFLFDLARFHQQFSLKSVRDIWTKDSLESVGVSDLHLIPCPSSFLKPLPWFSFSLESTKEVVGISITDRSLNENQKSTLIPLVIEFAKWLVQENYSPLFVFHDTADDIALAELITENNLTCVLPNTAREAVSIYNKCHYVIGMRGHSLILAAGQEVPFIGISYNQKVDAFMEMVEMQDYCINQNEVTDQTVLVKYFEKMVTHKNELIKGIKHKQKEFHKQNIDYCKKAIALLSLHVNL